MRLKASLAVFACLCASACASEAPHVIFVLVDDWGSMDAAYREKEERPGVVPQLRTPVIDRLAAEGAKLQNYYVQHICTPTRSQLMSSRYQIHTGLQHDIIQGGQRSCLPPRFKTMADGFKALNYSTHMIGKWHLGIYKDECMPWNRGFDSYYGYLTGSEVYYTHTQRTPRGNSSTVSGEQNTRYPDFRTQEGVVDDPCIAHPAALLNPHSAYYKYPGALVHGDDLHSGTNFTVDSAEAWCDSNASCKGFTYELSEGVPMFYFKGAISLNTDGDWVSFTRSKISNDPACYSTMQFMNRTLAIIDDYAKDHGTNLTQTRATQEKDPLFIYLALQNVHEPIEVPEMYSEPFEDTILDVTRRKYVGMVSVVDEALGNLTRALEENNMMKNTVLVVSSDNGGWLYYAGINYPYRGGKITLWDGGLRGLGFVHAPGRVPVNSTVSNLFHVTDWGPTLLRAAGADAQTMEDLGMTDVDGVDQWAVLTQQQQSQAAPPRTEILHNIDSYQGLYNSALRVGDYKLLYGDPGGPDWWCDVCREAAGCLWTLYGGPKTIAMGGTICHNHTGQGNLQSQNSIRAQEPQGPPVLLFNIRDDPREEFDLSQTHPDKVQELLQRLAVYNASAVPTCFPAQDAVELGLAPLDGYWGVFHDQRDTTDPNCALQRGD